jgi:hypothetical protein
MFGGVKNHRVDPIINTRGFGAEDIPPSSSTAVLAMDNGRAAE